MPTSTMLRAIYDIFKPTPNKITRCSLSFDQILRIETWPYVWMHIAYTSMHAIFQDVLSYFSPFKPNPIETTRQSFTFEQFLKIQIRS